MVIPCFECGDDVPVDENAEMESALCSTCIGTFQYWSDVASYSDEAYSGIADYDGYQYTEI